MKKRARAHHLTFHRFPFAAALLAAMITMAGFLSSAAAQAQDIFTIAGHGTIGYAGNWFCVQELAGQLCRRFLPCGLMGPPPGRAPGKITTTQPAPGEKYPFMSISKLVSLAGKRNEAAN
jgi:hypothetical protein